MHPPFPPPSSYAHLSRWDFPETRLAGRSDKGQTCVRLEGIPRLSWSGDSRKIDERPGPRRPVLFFPRKHNSRKNPGLTSVSRPLERNCDTLESNYSCYYYHYSIINKELFNYFIIIIPIIIKNSNWHDSLFFKFKVFLWKDLIIHLITISFLQFQRDLHIAMQLYMQRRNYLQNIQYI